MDFWSTHFSWPAGDVYGNLIASAVCFVLAGIPVRAVWRRHTKHQAAKHEQTHRLLRDLHARLDNTTPPEGEDP